MRGPAEGLRHGRWAILNAPTGVRLAPSPVQGAAPEEGQREPHRHPSSEVPPQTTQNCGKHVYALSMCQTWFCILLPFISLFILTTVL